MEEKRKATGDEFPQASEERCAGRGASVGTRANVALGASSPAVFSFRRNATVSSHIRHVGRAGASGQASFPTPGRSTRRAPERPPPGRAPRRPPTGTCRGRSRRAPKRGARRAEGAGAASRDKDTPLESRVPSRAIRSRVAAPPRRVRARPRAARRLARVARRDAARVVASLDGDGRARVRRVVGAPRGRELGATCPRTGRTSTGRRTTARRRPGSAGTRRTRTTPGRSTRTASRFSASSSARRFCRRGFCSCFSRASPRRALAAAVQRVGEDFLGREERTGGGRARARPGRRGGARRGRPLRRSTARSSSTTSFSTATAPSRTSRRFSSPCRSSSAGAPPFGLGLLGGAAVLMKQTVLPLAVGLSLFTFEEIPRRRASAAAASLFGLLGLALPLGVLAARNVSAGVPPLTFDTRQAIGLAWGNGFGADATTNPPPDDEGDPRGGGGLDARRPRGSSSRATARRRSSCRSSS